MIVQTGIEHLIKFQTRSLIGWGSFAIITRQYKLNHEHNAKQLEFVPIFKVCKPIEMIVVGVATFSVTLNNKVITAKTQMSVPEPANAVKIPLISLNDIEIF